MQADVVADVVVKTMQQALGGVFGRLDAAEAQRQVDAQTIAALTAQVQALERTPGPAGPLGAIGPIGDTGPPGAPGERGEVGPIGETGGLGAGGEKGLQGERGPEGPAGTVGRDGLPGVSGAHGLQGPPGEKGLDGQHGVNGLNGTLENVKASFDGERTLTLCFNNGDPIDGGVVRFDIPIYRGVYVAGKAYELSDRVTWGGSEWHCLEATITKPGESKAWQLCVKRGRDGKDGSKA